MKQQRNRNRMRRILALCLTLCLALPLCLFQVSAAPITANNAIVLNPDLLKKAGTQTIWGPCACYSMAYSKTVLDNSVHNWWEFTAEKKASTKNYSCQWGQGYTSKTTTDKKQVLQLAYQSINAGRPFIVFVTKNNDQHYVTLVGYQNVKSLDSLTESNFLMLDSSGKYGGTKAIPLNFSLRKISSGKYQYVTAEPYAGSAKTTAGTEIPAAPANSSVIPDGVYTLVHQSGKTLETAGTSSKSNVQVGSRNQQFQVTRTRLGWYHIVPVSAKNLAVNSFSYTPAVKTNCNLYGKVSALDSTQGWYFTKTDSGYIIRSAYNHKLTLAVSGSNVQLGSDAQIWTLKNDKGETLNPNPDPTPNTNPNLNPNVSQEVGDAVSQVQSAIGAVAGALGAALRNPDGYADIEPGTYYLTNKATGKVLDVRGNEYASVSNSIVQIYARQGAGNLSQRFVFTKTSGGWWSLAPASNLKLAINAYSDTPKDGTAINTWTALPEDSSQGWYLKPAGGGYYAIVNAYAPALCLTPQGAADLSKVQLKPCTGADNQLWTLTQVV